MSQIESSVPSDKPAEHIEPKKVRRRRSSRSGIKKWRRRLLRIFHPRYVLSFVIAVASVVTVGALVLTTDARNRVESSLTSLSRVVDTLSKQPGTELTST